MRHEKVLCKLLERLDIVGRTQKLPDIYHVVMLHPKAIIQRPSSKSFDTSSVIKADQFPTWHKSFVGKIGVGTLFKTALNMRSLDTIKEWGEKLVREHRPADLLALPDFMRPREPAKAAMPPAAVFSAPALMPSMAQVAQVQAPSPVNRQPEEPARQLICAHCAAKITYPEGKFCWNNAKRFGGLAYCREHQALYS